MSDLKKFPAHIDALEILCGHTPRESDYLRLAYMYSWANSHDPKTKNGSVLLTTDGFLTYGCNHLPEGLDPTEERLTTPALKDPLIQHAETDAILKAGQAGRGTKSATLFCNWAPCISCAGAIITAGVQALVVHKQKHDKTYPKYLLSIETAVGYLREAGVSYRMFDGFVGGCQDLMAGEIWEP